MMRALAASILLASPALAAGDDATLDRIPDLAAPPPAAADPTDVLYAQADIEAFALRGDLAVPVPPPRAPRWEARLFLDAREMWSFAGDLTLAYSGRLNLRALDGVAMPSRREVRHDLRELYLGWHGGNGWFVDLGRINLKSGVAEGFNPTDVFKTRTATEPLSADPTVLREDRLGTLMLKAERIWNGGAVTAAIAPKLTRDTPLYSTFDLPSFDPMFDRTNAHTRILLKASTALPGDPEAMAYAEDGRWRFGLDATFGIGEALIAYVEWAGGSRAPLADEAWAYGIATRTIPAGTPPLLPAGDRRFANDLALGASWSVMPDATLDLEYDRHDTGFSGADWRTWFAAGAMGSPSIDGALWFIRGYAAEQQEPMARDTLFLRGEWRDAFVRDLKFTAFVDSDLRDGSGFAQATADYDVSSAWTVGALVTASYGARRSDFGSLPQGASGMIRLARYF